MEKMLVVVFENETKAYEGSHALIELDQEGSIAIYAEAVIQKNNDGTVSMKRAEDRFPIGATGGTGLGALIGLLGGPIGLGIGAALGATAGLVSDLYVAGIDEDFLADASTALKPGKFAVVADITEEWVTPVDTRMETLGGIVFRTERKHFEEDQRARDIAALRDEIDQLNAEQARVTAERKAKIQAQIDELNRKLNAKLDQAKQRSQQLETETDAKVKALQKKAATANREAKAAINQRISDMKKTYEQGAATLRSATAKQLRKAAAKIEKVG